MGSEGDKLRLVVGDNGPTRGWRRRFVILGGVVAYALLHAPSSTEPAIANGDTRTLMFVNEHTKESGSFTFLVNGAYDQVALDKLNWFMRDWRLNEQVKMDPHLFDILWDVYRESGSNQAIDVLSAYRSPQTNAMLRRRSRQVAERSQHMQGKAIDAHFIDIHPGPIRDIAMRMQEGGVGFYPIGSTPWVHIDSGTVRYWPRMSRSALARLFPDGKTVFIPSDGQPMEQYAAAKAMIESARRRCPDREFVRQSSELAVRRRARGRRGRRGGDWRQRGPLGRSRGAIGDGGRSRGRGAGSCRGGGACRSTRYNSAEYRGRRTIDSKKRCRGWQRSYAGVSRRSRRRRHPGSAAETHRVDRGSRRYAAPAETAAGTRDSVAAE